MKTAGLVLDFYDDLTGEILKTVCPTPDDLPESVKTAHFLSPEERNILRDEAYALILHNDGEQLRKFACIDPGNTVLSTLYFIENHDKLPVEAVKTAAVNLKAFNEEFGLPVPEVVKLAAATGMARRRDSFKQPVVGDEADWAQRTNLVSVRGGADSGRVIPTANQMKTANVVDVSALEPEPLTINKKAKIAALGSQYSLDSYSDVKDAIQFFSESWTLMAPESRHEFSVKTASRAEELGIQVPELMARYGSTEYGPDVEAHLANRRSMAPQFTAVWNDLQEKRAMIEPEQFAQLLKEADELCNLQYEYGGAVFDPYYATFGGQGQEKLAWAWSTADGDRLTEETLRAIPHEALGKAFSKDFVDAFSHDPVTIFESMPDTHKNLIANLVP